MNVELFSLVVVVVFVFEYNKETIEFVFMRNWTNEFAGTNLCKNSLVN